MKNHRIFALRYMLALFACVATLHAAGDTRPPAQAAPASTSLSAVIPGAGTGLRAPLRRVDACVADGAGPASIVGLIALHRAVTRANALAANPAPPCASG